MRRTLLPLVLALVACGDDVRGDTDALAGTDGPASDPGSTSTASTDASAGATSDGATMGTGTPTTDADESTGDLPSLEPANAAGGIRITNVELNQGVGLLVGVDGAPQGADQRVAPIIAGRDALVRIDYALEADFAPRDLEARVHIGDETYVDIRPIAGPSDWTTLDGTFTAFIDAGDLGAGATLEVELVEPDGAATVGADAGARFPADGPMSLDAWADRMVLDIMLVPMTCDGFEPLELTEEKLANFEAFLFNTYPVQTLNLTVHEPVRSATCSEFYAAEYDLPALREADGADPWVYYGGLLPGDGGGYSIAVQGGDQVDYRRTFANHVWRDEGLTADLFAHELGHNHGRDHAFEDPSFPTETGDWCGPRPNFGWGPRSAAMPTSGYSNDVGLGLSWFDPRDNLLAPTDASCDGRTATATTTTTS